MVPKTSSKVETLGRFECVEAVKLEGRMAVVAIDPMAAKDGGTVAVECLLGSSKPRATAPEGSKWLLLASEIRPNDAILIVAFY